MKGSELEVWRRETKAKSTRLLSLAMKKNK